MENITAEQTLLGCMVTKKEYLIQGLSKLKSNDFSRGGHQVIFESMAEMFKDSKGVDIVTLGAYMTEKGIIQKVGGFAYLAQLMEIGGGYGHVNEYIQTIKELSEKRQLKTALQYSLSLLESDTPHEELLSQTQKNIHQVLNRRMDRKYRMTRTVTVDYYGILEQRKSNPMGISWGFGKLNSTLGLILPKRVYYAGGRPGQGKTALANSIAMNVAKEGYPVYFNTQEMSEEQIMDRFVSAETKIPGHILQHGLLQDDDWVKVANVSGKIATLPLAIDEERQTTMNLFLKVRQFQMDMLQKAKELRENGKTEYADRIERCNGLGLLIIDYLQLFKDSRRGVDQDEWTQQVSGFLVEFAKELNIPILVLTQLNRENEKRANKKPQMSDMRGGGAQEQDAWAVILLHREEYYDPDTTRKGVAEVIIAKNRSGPTKTIELHYLKEYTKFEEAWWDEPDRNNQPKAKSTDIRDWKERKSGL